jgi:hypothetical protein
MRRVRHLNQQVYHNIHTIHFHIPYPMSVDDGDGDGMMMVVIR